MSVTSSPFVNNSAYGTPIKMGTRSNTANESKSSSKISKPSHQEKHQSSSGNRYNRKKNQTEGKVTLQIEEEEDLDEYSIKHVAASRYLRNHRLINEIFSDTVVPDSRNIITTHRINHLKKQVRQLMWHQKNSENDIQQIEEKFQTRKRKFIESSEKFKEDMKKLCASKPVDPVKYQKMVEQAVEQLKLEQQKQLDELKRQENAKRQISNVNVENNTPNDSTTIETSIDLNDKKTTPVQSSSQSPSQIPLEQQNPIKVATPPIDTSVKPSENDEIKDETN